MSEVGTDGQRWIVVADSPFLPATDGGEKEHLGFVRAAADAGLLALLVLPGGDTVDQQPYRRLLPGVPLVTTARRRNPLLLAAPRTPFVISSRPAPDGLVARARRLATDATGIVLFSYKSRAIGEALARGLGLPLVLRQHNREGAYHRSLAEQSSGPRRWVTRLEAWRIERDERRLAHADWLSGTADISADDAAWRVGIGARNVVHVPPFALAARLVPHDDRGPGSPEGGDGSDSDGGRLPPANDRWQGRVLFLGTLDTATNTGGLDWMLSQVWPGVLAAHPTAVLDVVGRGPSASLRRRLGRSERVVLSADVADPAPFLARASVAVNPVVSGSGVNIKMVDYLDAGLPVVSTSLATRGLPLRPGTDLMVHDEPHAFAEALLTLLRDPDRAMAMGRAGRERVHALLDPSLNLSRIATMLERT